MGEKNFGQTYKDIVQFIKAKTMSTFDGGKPIVFTHADFDDEVDAQHRMLDSFMDQFSGGRSDIAIYPINHLFYALIKELAARNRVDDIPNENYVNALLSYDPYDSTCKICCKVLW